MESVDRVMVIDGGGRGQALAHKLANEGLDVVVSPGNPGNENFAHSTGVQPTDIAGQLKAARDHDIDLTIVGGEDPLDRGIVDEFQTVSQAIFGPPRDKAWIETDRRYAKKFSRRQGVPIGDYREFGKKDETEALRYAVRDASWPLFVKDNAPAGGKGTKPCRNLREFRHAINKLKSYVVETTVPGPEASHHAFCDGKTQLSIPFMVRDHKRVGENDSGDMSGGMGVVGPLTSYSAEEVEALGERFAAPVVNALGFKGLLFSGLKGAKGQERNLEWNARFGDPEAQVFTRLMKSDLLPVLMACVEGNLETTQKPEWFLGQYAVSLVLAAPGYPKKPRQKLLIEGLEVAAEMDSVEVLQAATRRKKGKLYTAGGRALNVVTVASSMETAIKQAYRAAEAITFDGQPPLVRPDIGRKTLAGY